MQPSVPSTRHSRAWLVLLAAAVAAITAAHLLDWWAHSALANPRLAERDLGRMLRVLGYLPFWMIAAFALGLCDAAHHASGAVRWAERQVRALLIVGGAALGGLSAEILKLLSRRERPDAGIGEYVFREWAERPFHTGGIGLASSHAGVAFGATFMLARLFPRARWVWYGLGAGCAFSRVAAGAHFLSDVVVAGVLGYGVVALLWQRFGHLAERARERAAGAAVPLTTGAPAPGVAEPASSPPRVPVAARYRSIQPPVPGVAVPSAALRNA